MNKANSNKQTIHRIVEWFVKCNNYRYTHASYLVHSKSIIVLNWLEITNCRSPLARASHNSLTGPATKKHHQV